MKTNEQRGFFDEQFRLEKIAVKDPLSALSTKVNWEQFRTEVEKPFTDIDYSQGGRPPFDRLMMFKVLVLQEFYGLSDEQMEFHLLDRLSFQKFIGRGLEHAVPDEKTIWLYRDTLTKSGVIKSLFDKLNKHLHQLGLIAHKGIMVDASFAKVPVQRNTPDENKQIKGGQTPDWEENKKRQKDVDANWTKKNAQNHFGYKQHIKADLKSKLITAVLVTPASTHETNIIESLLDKSDRGQKLYADSAYKSMSRDAKFKSIGITPCINTQGYKHKPMTNKEREQNKKFSKKRCRVEHIFGWLKRKPGIIRSIGIQRVTARIILRMIGYNLQRATFLIRNYKKSIQMI